MNFNNGLSTNWLHYEKKILILLMRKITVLKVLAIEIVYLISLKEETGVDYVVTIDKSSYRGQSLWLHNFVIYVIAITDWLCNYEQTPIIIVIYKLCMCVLLFLKLWQVPREVSMYHSTIYIVFNMTFLYNNYWSLFIIAQPIGYCNNIDNKIMYSITATL
jgi:hypothetical protein